MTSLTPTERFSNRVENYVKYRPSYPPAIIPFLVEVAGFTPASIVADIGSGTGLLTQLFLAQGNVVFGVEPNAEMRLAGEEALRDFPNFHSIAATAEQTTLPAQSVDFVVAGQAFHWFVFDQARAEFQRILRPGGWVAAVWNGRPTIGHPFWEDYEVMLHAYSPEYPGVSYKAKAEQEAEWDLFFGAAGYQVGIFANGQQLDYTGLRGRLLSSSYAPLAGHPNHEPMLAELSRIFDKYQEAGKIEIDYETRLYLGRLG